MRKANSRIVIAGLAVFLFAMSCTSRRGPTSASGSQSSSLTAQQECEKQLARANWLKGDLGPHDEALANTGVGIAFRRMQANQATFDALNGFTLSGSEKQAMIERVKAMSDSERVVAITNSILTQVSQAKPDTFTAALGSTGSKADTLDKAMSSFHEFLVAQAKDYLIQAGKTKADVDQKTDGLVASLFETSLEESGCKREGASQGQGNP